MFEGITIVDTETTNAIPTEAEICEVATGTFENDEWHIKCKLYGTNEPIPYEASAINHISRNMIKGLPKFGDNLEEDLEILNLVGTTFYVAHNAKFDMNVLEKSFDELGMDLGYTAKDSWICTMRLARHLYPDLPYHNLSYLRYALELPVSDDLVPHRGETDVTVAAALFEHLVVNAIDSGLVDLDNRIMEQMHKLCWNYINVSRWPIGKHRGTKLEEIPTDYYFWAIQNLDELNDEHDDYDEDLAKSVEAVLSSRELGLD